MVQSTKSESETPTPQRQASPPQSEKTDFHPDLLLQLASLRLDQSIHTHEKKVAELEGKLKFKMPLRFLAKECGEGSGEREKEAFTFASKESEKTQNLRMRKSVSNSKRKNVRLERALRARLERGGGGGRSRSRVSALPTNAGVASPPKMHVFSISLTKEEIEEDFIKMTGAKPPKKPKKRSKNERKQLDAVFPGLSLSTVTPKKYQVPDPLFKD